MSIQKVNEIFIGGGAALSADNTSLPSIAVQMGVVGSDMTTLNPSGGDTITTQPTIYLVNKLANGEFKRSLPIKGTSVTGFKGESYRPAARNVWSVGYNRLTATGSIIANNSTIYNASILFKDDKGFFSERPERLPITFTSSGTATQLSVATQLCNFINNSAYGASPSGMKVIHAVVVGDGTGAYGLTGASNYGVEMTGLSINQFKNTTYTEDLVYFKVGVEDASGFEGTEVSEIQALDRGTGTYNHIYNMENFFFGYEGVSNRRLWPIPELSYLTSSTGFTSGAFTITVAGTSGEDVATFSAPTSLLLPAGSVVTLGTVVYEIKYWLTDSIAVLTSVLAGTLTTGAVKGTAWYDIITISVNDVTFQDGAGVGQFSPKVLYIATPAIEVGATGDSAMTDPSPEADDLMSILNDWMATTPGAYANISI